MQYTAGKYKPLDPAYIPRAVLSVESTVYSQLSELSVDFSQMLGLHLERGCGKDIYMNGLDISAQIVFGEVPAFCLHKEYVISLRCARVVLDPTNADILAGTCYRQEIPRSEFIKKSKLQQESKKANWTAFAAKGGIESRIPIPKIPFLSPQVGLSGSHERSRGNEAKEEVVSEIISKTMLVCPSGHGVWTIGGPQGDPRQPTNDLRVPIEARPLCQMHAIKYQEPVTGTVCIQAGKTDFVINEIEKSKAMNRIYKVFEGLNFDPVNQKIFQRAVVENDLKKRMAALAAMKNSRPVPDGLYQLALAGFSYMPTSNA